MTHSGGSFSPSAPVYAIRQKSSGRFLDAHEDAANDFGLVTRPDQSNASQRCKICKHLGELHIAPVEVDAGVQIITAGAFSTGSRRVADRRRPASQPSLPPDRRRQRPGFG
jgi:hypothetical protein